MINGQWTDADGWVRGVQSKYPWELDVVHGAQPQRRSGIRPDGKKPFGQMSGSGQQAARVLWLASLWEAWPWAAHFCLSSAPTVTGASSESLPTGP